MVFKISSKFKRKKKGILCRNYFLTCEVICLLFHVLLFHVAHISSFTKKCIHASVPADQWRTHPSQWDFLRDVLTQIKSDCLPVWWKVFRHIKRGEGWDYSKRHKTAKRNFKKHLVTLGDLTGGISGPRSARGSHHHSTCKFLSF